MQPFELVGPSYTSQSPNLADMLTMNWYPESSEGEGQSPAALYPTPGLEVFCDLTDTPIRGEITANDRTFVAAGAHFYEIFSDGTFHLYGNIQNDDTPVSMVAGSSQILIASAGEVYVFDFSNGHIQTATLSQGGNLGILTSSLSAGILTSSLGGGGANYAIGDTFAISMGDMDATGIVDTISGGAVLTYHLTNIGTNYIPGSAVATVATGVQPGAGTGLTINILTVGGGSGYAPNDTFTVSAGNMDATGIVDTVSSGAVTAYHLTSVGSNYSVTSGAPTVTSGVQPGVGTGLSLNVLTLGGGYLVGDTGTIQGGTVPASYIVTTIDASGNVTGFTVTDGGSGYTVSTNVMTATGGAQPGIGIGFQVNITAVTVTNSFAPLPNGTLLGPISFVAYVESFFVALLSNSNQFEWSAPLDATTWDPLDTNKVSVFAGNVLSMFADHNELWFWGERQTQPYFLSGGPNTFDIIQGAFMEAGIFAPNSPVRLDNSVFWLGGDERGAGVVWRANGYTPSRVSNHAIEFALQGYLTKYGSIGLSNAVGYSYQDQGHGFYVLYFPTANATWVLDTATNMWHQRGYWNAAIGQFTAHRSQNHTFNFGKHLVGDWASGKVYNMNISFYDDAGNQIRRVRRARHASADQSWVFHKTLQIYAEMGVGPTPPLTDGAGNPRDPMLNLRWSNDGGHVWSNELSLGLGQAGQYGSRLMFRRLGRARARVYEVSGSDPVPYRLIGAYLDISAGDGA